MKEISARRIVDNAHVALPLGDTRCTTTPAAHLCDRCLCSWAAAPRNLPHTEGIDTLGTYTRRQRNWCREEACRAWRSRCYIADTGSHSISSGARSYNSSTTVAARLDYILQQVIFSRTSGRILLALDMAAAHARCSARTWLSAFGGPSAIPPACYPQKHSLANECGRDCTIHIRH